MRHLLICCAAMAILASDQSGLAAQSGTTGSYQTITTPTYTQGQNSNITAPGYPGITDNGQVGAPIPAANNGVINGSVQTAPRAVNNSGCENPIVYGNGVYGNGAVYGQGYGTMYGNGAVYGNNITYGNGVVQGHVQNGGTVQGSVAPNPVAVQGNSCNSVLAPGAATANVGSNYVADSVYGGGIFGADCGGYVIDGSAYTNGSSDDRNYFYGLNGLVFDRDFEDDVFLTRNPAGDVLLSTDADTGTLGGLEFFLGTRSCSGNGFEARYWGLFADEASYTLNGASFDTYLYDLEGLSWPATGDNLRTVFNQATSNTIVRDNEIHNIELSMLRRGGCFTTRRGRCGTYELLHGFRWFEFDEEFHWDLVSPSIPTELFFDTRAKNTLLGYQLGGRTEICMGDRFRLLIGTKGGLYNNRARVSQSMISDTGIYSQIGGIDYNFDDAKNDVSFLGELNIGTALHMNACSRITIGYRVIGVSGLALAPNQYSNFNALPAIRDVQSNGSLLLHGAVFGFEFCR